MKSSPAMDVDRAEGIALAGLTFLAEDGARLGRFLTLTGMDAGELKESAGARRTLLAVLEHLLADESLLLVFSASKGVPPQALAPAHSLLAKSGAGGEAP
jgi:hypothetical protein